MDISKMCKICGKFNEINVRSSVCKDCIEKDEKQFRRIKEYLQQNPGAKIFVLSAELNISVKTIKRYLREDRLEILEKNNVFLRCEKCNKPIQSGTYCDLCALEMRHDYKSFYFGKSDQSKTSTVKYSPRSSGRPVRSAVR